MDHTITRRQLNVLSFKTIQNTLHQTPRPQEEQWTPPRGTVDTPKKKIELWLKEEVIIFGDSRGEEGQFLGNLQVLRKVIATSGKYADYLNEIQASHKLGYLAYRIAPEGSPNLIFMYEHRVFLLGSSSSTSVQKL